MLYNLNVFNSFWLNIVLRAYIAHILELGLHTAIPALREARLIYS